MLREVASYLYRQSKYVMGRIQGWTLGIVEDVEDPLGLGRVRLRFPWHKEGELSPWAWPATAHLRDQEGSTFHIPQRGEVAVVVFLEGDMTKPAYLGTLWTPGGTGPLGQIPPHKALIKGKSSQTPDSYDHMKAPDLSSKPYPEPPSGAWVTNEPKDRVDEWKHYGGIRLLWEAFKRRLRFWSHPSTPFHLQVEHYDGDSVNPPKGTPYHALTLTSPDGTKIVIEDDGSSGVWTLKLEHKAGHFLEVKEGGGQSQVLVQDKKGQKVLLDAAQNKILVQDLVGQQVLLDANANTVLVKANSTVNVDAPGGTVNIGPGAASVNLAGGGPAVARLGDQVIVYGVMPGPGTATGQIISGSPKVTSG